MKFLKSGGLILILIVVMAAVMRVLFPAMPQVIRSLAAVPGDAQAAELTLETRLSLFKTAQFQAIGLPDEEPGTLEFTRAYINGLQNTKEKIDVVVTESSKVEALITTAQRVVTKIDSAHPELLVQGLRELQGKNLRVLLVFSSMHATHRLGATTLRLLEDHLGLQIPTIIIARLALTEDAERGLVPACEGNPMSQSGQVVDLGCNILALSKKAQVEKPPLDHYLVSIQEEAADEELVAIYRPR